MSVRPRQLSLLDLALASAAMGFHVRAVNRSDAALLPCGNERCPGYALAVQPDNLAHPFTCLCSFCSPGRWRSFTARNLLAGWTAKALRRMEARDA